MTGCVDEYLYDFAIPSDVTAQTYWAHTFADREAAPTSVSRIQLKPARSRRYALEKGDAYGIRLNTIHESRASSSHTIQFVLSSPPFHREFTTFASHLLTAQDTQVTRYDEDEFDELLARVSIALRIGL